MAARPWLQTLPSLIFLTAYFAPVTHAATKMASDPQLVRLTYMQGDVRFNRGDGKQPDLKQSWEQAVMNLPIEQNYALATGNGRAELELENGSVVYVAENTVVLFNELTSTNDVSTTRIELVSGSVTAGVQSQPHEIFEIDTPTQQFRSGYPERSFLRIDAYLDGMELTSQIDTPALAQGQTIIFVDGQSPQVTKPGAFRPIDDFDNWTRARYEARTATVAAALKASGLTSPMIGLADMYQNGTFTPCPPYGICWEPKSVSTPAAAEPNPAQATPAPSAQATPTPRKTQPVIFQALDSDCPFPAWTNWTDTSHAGGQSGQTGMKSSQMNFPPPWFLAVCHYTRWGYQHGSYRSIVRRRRIHHPVHWLKTGKQTGFVPASPLDKKGQPPANLRHGIFVASREVTSERVEHLDFDSKEKVEILPKAPKEFRTVTAPDLTKAGNPEIGGRLLAETLHDAKLTDVKQSEAKITYDYGKGKFVREGVVMPGRTSKPVVVSSVNSHGSISDHGIPRRDGGGNTGSPGGGRGAGGRESSPSRSSSSSGRETSGGRSTGSGGRETSETRSSGSSEGERGGGGSSSAAGSRPK